MVYEGIIVLSSVNVVLMMKIGSSSNSLIAARLLSVRLCFARRPTDDTGFGICCLDDQTSPPTVFGQTIHMPPARQQP